MMGLPLGGKPEPVTDADAVGEIPDGVPVRMEIDVEHNAYRYVALTPAELKQRADDTAAAVIQSAKDDAAEQARDALAAKLASGKATDAEVQQALAALLGGGTP